MAAWSRCTTSWPRKRAAALQAPIARLVGKATLRDRRHHGELRRRQVGAGSGRRGRMVDARRQIEARHQLATQVCTAAPQAPILGLVVEGPGARDRRHYGALRAPRPVPDLAGALAHQLQASSASPRRAIRSGARPRRSFGGAAGRPTRAPAWCVQQGRAIDPVMASGASTSGGGIGPSRRDSQPGAG